MTSPSAIIQYPSSAEGLEIKDTERKIARDTAKIKYSVEFLNGISSNSTIKEV